jgi:hypothetical protein
MSRRNRNVPFGKIAAGGRDGREISDGTERDIGRESDGTGKTEQLTIKAASRDLKTSCRQGKERRRVYRSRRERRGSFGELPQFDGSRRRRFERRGPSCRLHTVADGAANLRSALFFGEETASGRFPAMFPLMDARKPLGRNPAWATGRMAPWKAPGKHLYSGFC